MKTKKRSSPEMEHFFPRTQVKTKKKRSSPEMEPFFSPNLGTDLRSDAHQSQIIGGDAGEDHTQVVGGVYSQIIGGIYPPSPPGFGTSGCMSQHEFCLVVLFLRLLARAFNI